MVKSEYVQSCPWHHRYSVGAYAAESVVRLLVPSVADFTATFQSMLAKKLARLRRAFTLDIIGLADDQSRFAGAVLAKIAQRGFPAPCSTDLERFLLKQAQDADLLSWVEGSKSGAINFKIVSHNKDLPALLKACFFAELLLDDDEVDALLKNYLSLCTPNEKYFFEMILDSCPDPRLALFIIPQRLIITMLRLTKSLEEQKSIPIDSRVDFAIEIPKIGNEKFLRLVIEIDDKSHKGAQKELDNQRDSLLRSNGWNIIRLSTLESKAWKKEVEKILEALENAITNELIEAAKILRSLPTNKKQPILDLVTLPIAEAQLTIAVARWIYTKGNASFRIANPQGLNLKVVLDCIDSYLTNLEKLYGLKNFGRPELVESVDFADIVYFALPSPKAWELLNLGNSTILTPTISFSEYEDALLEDALPFPILEELINDEEKLENILTFFLNQLFRKEKFWAGQVKIIKRALLLKDVIGLLPTAAGKSLCYQMASLLQPGFTIVVQPLRSLMWDQQDNLDVMGIHRSTAIMSFAEITPDEETRIKEEGYTAIEKGLRYFVFISPERFQIPEFREQVKSFVGSYPIPYCVVDEAHCVSEWGHDFRPAYLNLGWLVPSLCKYKDYKPCFIALTGTASQNVLTDIHRELLIPDLDSIVSPENFDRKELNFQVKKVKVEDRLNELKALLKNIIGYRPGQPNVRLPSGLIFTYFVNDSNVGVKLLRDELRNSFPEIKDFIELYSGAKPYSLITSERNWELKKVELQRRFKLNDIPILVCTHSFGMGIDKPDIRFTIHAMLPRSLEEFYQQAGRAGRDREMSQCFVIFSDDHPNLADSIYDPISIPIEKTDEMTRDIPRKQQSDPIRNIWFLRNSFYGKETDKNIINYLWDYLANQLPTYEGDRIQIELSFTFLPDHFFNNKGKKGGLSEEKQQALEKAIYRLRVIGAIEDYLKDYSRRKFIISIFRYSPTELERRFKEYLRRYTTEGEMKKYTPRIVPKNYNDAVKLFVHQVVEFVYDKIEQRRRRAMWEMLQAARDAVILGMDKFREQMISYLEESEFTKPVIELTKTVSPQSWFKLLNKAEGVDGLIKLFGACRRQIEEYPEHPGLLFLTGFCRLHYGDEGLKDINNSFIILKKDYPEINRYQIAVELISAIKYHFPTKLEKILEILIEIEPTREILIFCYKEATHYSSPYNIITLIFADNILNALKEKQKG